MELIVYSPIAVGCILRANRQHKKISTRTLSKITGMSRATVMTAERIPKNAYFQTIFKYLDAVGLEMVIRSKE